ncbi:GNAT family N-acetyltransferase [Melittangium boletus]|uniref:GNAT family N-acetyltransferase n=1 Tax=Melittangium boletus TaxID=83453 RepID=UPI003DA54F2A
MSSDDVHESNARFQEAWRFFARQSAAGEVLDLPGVSIASSNVAWAMMNAAFPPGPVDTERALSDAAATAARHFAPKRLPWMLAVCEDWVPTPLRERAGALLAPHGLRPAVVATGMVAERLVPPLNLLPRLEVRQAQDSRGRMDLADVNSHSYDMPVATGRATFDVPGLFAGDNLGFVGYRHEQAATCAAVMRGESAAYVSMVATHPTHRRLGLAEAILRHVLGVAQLQWGLERSVLHATPEGLPVYRRLGYRSVTRFCFYMATPLNRATSP